jgi:hypothetical protein
MKNRVTLIAIVIFVSVSGAASAQSAPERSSAWSTATTITAVGALGTQLLMPRVFYADPEVTVGWKARWHVSVLAPIMTLTSLTLLNEYGLKDGFEGFRPGCDEANQGGPGCETYGMASTHSFAAFSALGQGTATFLVDTFKWSDGRFNVGAFAGQVFVPLVLSTITGIGRSSGNFETGGQILAGGGLGLASGLLTGATYALLQRPECGYTGSLVCW